VRHATEVDLDRLDDLLGRLREIDGLVEGKRGKFQRRSKAFLHFHEDADDLYADVRLTDDFVRRRVTTAAEQADLVGEIEALLSRSR
jgi:hypothetical protein